MAKVIFVFFLLAFLTFVVSEKVNLISNLIHNYFSIKIKGTRKT